LESITVTAAGTLFTSTPVPDSPGPDSGVREKTSIVGSTTVAPEAAGAAGAFWARAEDAPNAKIPKVISEKRAPCNATPLFCPVRRSTPLSLVVFFQRRRNGWRWTDRQGKIESCILFPFLSAPFSKLAYPSIVRYFIYSNDFRAKFPAHLPFYPGRGEKIVAMRLAHALATANPHAGICAGCGGQSPHLRGARGPPRSSHTPPKGPIPHKMKRLKSALSARSPTCPST
jgi:hypothetical protein